MVARRRSPSLAEIAEAVRAEQDAPPRGHRRQPAPELREQLVHVLEVEGRLFEVVDTEADLTPEQALAFATSGGPVVWDSCGCGGGCGYETWSGRAVRGLTRAGPPLVRAGRLYELRDADGGVGVLVEGDIRWGTLR